MDLISEGLLVCSHPVFSLVPVLFVRNSSLLLIFFCPLLLAVFLLSLDSSDPYTADSPKSHFFSYFALKFCDKIRKKMLSWDPHPPFFSGCLLDTLTWETSIKIQNVPKMFPNRVVNKSSLLGCGLGAGDRAGSHFHTGRPDLHSSLRLKIANERDYRTTREERAGRGKVRGRIPVMQRYLREREEEKDRKKKRELPDGFTTCHLIPLQKSKSCEVYFPCSICVL